MLNDARPGSKKGHIFQINLSAGGVPNESLPKAEVSIRGLAGDRQDDLEHDGGLVSVILVPGEVFWRERLPGGGRHPA